MSALHFLLVDDNPDDRVLIRRTLAREFPEAEFTEVFDESGLSLALARADVAAVVTDFHLAWTNGLEVLERVRQCWPDCPIVMCTGTGDEATAVQAMKNGLDDYVLKTKKHMDRLPAALCGAMARRSECIERRKSDAALRDSEARYRALVESASDAILVADVETGLLLEANKQAEQLLGLPREKILGMHQAQLHPPEERQNYAGIFQQRATATADVSALDRELVVVDANGIHIPVEISSCVLTLGGQKVIQGIFRDIRQRRQAELENARLAAAVRHAEESVLITNAKGEVQYVNPAFEELTGYQLNEILGSNPRFLKSGEHDQAFYDGLRKQLDAGNAWTGTFCNKRKNGLLFQHAVTISPILHDNGAVVGFVCIGRDVTEELLAEERKQQARRVEAIGTLAGGISHDFNNILAGIMGYTQLVLHGIPNDQPAHQDLLQVMAAAERARDLVQQILTFSRQVNAKKEAVSLQKVLHEVIGLLRAALPSTIELVTEIGADAPPVVADATQMHQVLMNLGTNAFHAMRETTGTLRIALERLPKLSGRTPGGSILDGDEYLLLTFEDTGHGMDKETQQRIFDPYFSTKTQGEGSGLGMATVLGIIKNHRGAIEVQSTPGKGTRFLIYLPCAKEGRPLGSLGAAPPIVGGDERILVVDDEEILRSMMLKMLGALGYTVTVAPDATEALALLQKDPDAFDLIISDLTMPRMTGLHLAHEVRALRPDLPFILTTGYGEAAIAKQAKEAGVRAFLPKPAERKKIAALVRSVLDH